MVDLDINQQLFEAMRKKQPVYFKGNQYERVLDYIFWYDGSDKLRQSVVLLQNRSSVRALVSEVSVVADVFE